MRNRKVTIYGTLALALVMAGSTQAMAIGPQNLVMQIHQVKAIKECRGPFGSIGADEIDLGALVIDPVGRVRSTTLDLGQFGHDGSTKNFTKPRELATFKISGGRFPKVSQALLVLAERDAGGGFGKYLSKLVKEATTKVAAAKRAANVRPSQGYLLVRYPQIEEAGKEIAKEVLERLGKALLTTALDAREDDIFPASLQSVTVPGENFRFGNGQLTSPRSTVGFKKDQCNYSVTYSWRLS